MLYLIVQICLKDPQSLREVQRFRWLRDPIDLNLDQLNQMLYLDLIQERY